MAAVDADIDVGVSVAGLPFDIWAYCIGSVCARASRRALALTCRTLREAMTVSWLEWFDRAHARIRHTGSYRQRTERIFAPIKWNADYAMYRVCTLMTLLADLDYYGRGRFASTIDRILDKYTNELLCVDGALPLCLYWLCSVTHGRLYALMCDHGMSHAEKPSVMDICREMYQQRPLAQSLELLRAMKPTVSALTDLNMVWFCHSAWSWNRDAKVWYPSQKSKADEQVTISMIHDVDTLHYLFGKYCGFTRNEYISISDSRGWRMKRAVYGTKVQQHASFVLPAAVEHFHGNVEVLYEFLGRYIENHDDDCHPLYYLHDALAYGESLRGIKYFSDTQKTLSSDTWNYNVPALNELERNGISSVRLIILICRRMSTISFPYVRQSENDGVTAMWTLAPSIPWKPTVSQMKNKRRAKRIAAMSASSASSPVYSPGTLFLRPSSPANPDGHMAIVSSDGKSLLSADPHAGEVILRPLPSVSELRASFDYFCEPGDWAQALSRRNCSPPTGSFVSVLKVLVFLFSREPTSTAVMTHLYALSTYVSRNCGRRDWMQDDGFRASVLATWYTSLLRNECKHYRLTMKTFVDFPLFDTWRDSDALWRIPEHELCKNSYAYHVRKALEHILEFIKGTRQNQTASTKYRSLCEHIVPMLREYIRHVPVDFHFVYTIFYSKHKQLIEWYCDSEERQLLLRGYFEYDRYLLRECKYYKGVKFFVILHRYHIVSLPVIVQFLQADDCKVFTGIRIQREAKVLYELSVTADEFMTWIEKIADNFHRLRLMNVHRILQAMETRKARQQAS